MTSRVHLQRAIRGSNLSGLDLSPSTKLAVVARLLEIAQYVVNQEAHRTISASKSPRRPRGRPREKAMHEVFGGLAGVWIDYAQAVPGVSYFAIEDSYGGRFVEFFREFCGTLADALEGDLAASSLVKALRAVQENPRKVRTWLRAVGIPQFVTDCAR